MSTQPLYLSGALGQYSAAPAATSGKYVNKLTMGGAFLFLSCLLVVGSGIGQFRPNIAGMRVHPYLIPLGIAFPFLLISRIQHFPPNVLAGTVVFGMIYIASILNGGGGGIGEMAKVICGGISIVAAALLVRSHADFVAGALGLSIAIAVLAVRGLSDENVAAGGFQGIDVANKNSYSLYALPAILLAGFIILRMPRTRIAVKALLGLAAMCCLVAIFMSGNRSGYLGAVVIGLLLFKDRKIRGLLLVGAVIGAIVLVITSYGSTKVLDQRIKQTQEGTSSDRLRKALLINCIQVGLENPILGASPQGLPLAIGRRLQLEFHKDIVDPHNVFGQVIGGCGLICFAALIYIAVTLWQWGKPIKNPDADRLYADMGRLLRMYLILWCVRGNFSREILYAPGFVLALGLIIGALHIQKKWNLRPPHKARLAPPNQMLLPVRA